MANITVQELQDIAVKCVSDFFNEKTSLNEGLAKEASDRGLNSEQLKRAVEATNTLAHLKSLDVSSDRTTEFPVADYQEIVKLAFVPDLTSPPIEEEDETDSFGFAKSAAVEVETTMSYENAVFFLQKKAAVNDRELEDAKYELLNVAEDILKQAGELRKDPEILEKLSYSSVSDEYFTKLSSLLACEKPRKALPEGFFKSAAINSVERLFSLYKRAETLNVEIKDKTSLKQRLDQAVNTHVKEAGLLGKVFNHIGSGIGKVVSAPFKAAISAGTGITKATGVAINNAAAKTGMGQAAGLAVKPQSGSVRALKASALPLAGAAMDIGAYNYNVNPAKNQLGTVWDNLQG